MKKNVWQMPDSYLCMQEDLETDHNLFIGLTNDGNHVWQQEE